MVVMRRLCSFSGNDGPSEVVFGSVKRAEGYYQLSRMAVTKKTVLLKDWGEFAEGALPARDKGHLCEYMQDIETLNRETIRTRWRAWEWEM